MHKSLKRLAIGGATACLAVGLMATMASAAPRHPGIPRSTSTNTRSATALASAATCSGFGCDHTDPYVTGCAGSGASYGVVAGTPIYKGYTTVQAGYIQLWYSSTCGTNWARIVVYDDGLNDIFYVKSGVYTADGRSDIYDKYPGTSWTNQLYAPTVKARACGEILADSFGSGYTCTGWY